MITGKYNLQVCVAKEVPHSVEFFMQDGKLAGIHTPPLGKQMVDNIVSTDYYVAWECYAGTEGNELFRNVLMLNGNTNYVRGYVVGAAPFFRGFTPMYGEKEQGD